jgi:hypothetical protein
MREVSSTMEAHEEQHRNKQGSCVEEILEQLIMGTVILQVFKNALKPSHLITSRDY